MPQCGFSRATIQILGMQGVDPEKFTSYNVLEDEELRSGITHQYFNVFHCIAELKNIYKNRNQGI